MSWFRTEYRFRAPVAVDCSGGGGGAVGVVVSIPVDWDRFWASILPSGFDVVVTGADGVTVLDYERTFDAAARVLTFTIGPVSLPETAAHLLWIYYGNPAETVDRAVSVSVSGPKAGHIEVTAPTSFHHWAPDRFGARFPTARIGVRPSEVLDIHVGAWPLGHHADGGSAGSLEGEEIRAVSVSAKMGVDPADILDVSATRIVEIDGEPVVSVRLSEPPAGDYLLILATTTTTGQIREWRAHVAARDGGP